MAYEMWISDESYPSDALLFIYYASVTHNFTLKLCSAFRLPINFYYYMHY